ncbi:hypothetical protein ZEAMMB73_Zm00001d027505 [Zea mays]|uniref:Uncharacterized protein n=1 Tax=Zea mays TaxID=4577 RepID=A0A1D6JMQ3_MAIZE|nr:hypothetical protein ZEAMMB73_Zm00001d027505 [Zea mays]
MTLYLEEANDLLMQIPIIINEVCSHCNIVVLLLRSPTISGKANPFTFLFSKVHQLCFFLKVNANDVPSASPSGWRLKTRASNGHKLSKACLLTKRKRKFILYDHFIKSLSKQLRIIPSCANTLSISSLQSTLLIVLVQFMGIALTCIKVLSHSRCTIGCCISPNIMAAILALSLLYHVVCILYFDEMLPHFGTGSHHFPFTSFVFSITNLNNLNRTTCISHI